ncbi:MAG: BON domain-containing protein [Bryobacteraceae bacterium]
MNRILLLSILSGTILLRGFSLTAAPADVSTPSSKPAPSQGANSPQDKEIEATIQAKLAKSKIGKDGFKVRVQGGVATWEGTTSVVQHKGAATRMAKTAGAKKVVNNIKIGEDSRGSVDGGSTQDAKRRVQVKRSDVRSQ